MAEEMDQDVEEPESKDIDEDDEEIDELLNELEEEVEEEELKETVPKKDISSENVPIIAEIEQGKNVEQILSTETGVDVGVAEDLTADKEIDEIEKTQDHSVKEKFKDLPGYIEAILFEIGKPLKESELVDLLYEKFKADRIRIRWGLRKVMRALEAQNSSIQLINPTKDFWSFQLRRDLKDDFLSKIEKFIPEEEFISKRETQYLTEIAYRQPVTTTEILKILGADGYDYIRSLEAKDLISITKEGQSNVLRTTTKFAQLFGFDPELRSLKIQLVWRLKKLARSEAARDKDMLEQLKKDRQKYGS
ncbi:MAG: SMC-Scp complex subunit ScpB [Candidatus Helarchaeota archaeon]